MRLRPKAAAAAAFLSCAVVYSWFALPHLSGLGLATEEVTMAMPAMAMLGYGFQIKFPMLAASLGRLTIPVGIQDYHSAFESYLCLPFIAAFGHTAAAIRLYGAAMAAATLAALLALLLELTGDLASAWLGAALLAIYPSFVSGARLVIDMGSAHLFFESAALLCLARWRSRQRPAWLWLACFLLGCGVSIQSWFVYLVAALGVLGLALFRRRLAVKTAAGAAAALALGAAPLIIYVAWQLRGPGLPYWMSARTSVGVDNLAYAANLARRARQTLELFSRDIYLDMIFFGDGAPCRLLAAICGAGALRAAACAVPRLRGRLWREQAFFLALLGLTLLFSPFTASEIKPEHVFVLLPLGIILAALAFSELGGYLCAPRRWAAAACVISLALAFDHSRLQEKIALPRGIDPHYSGAVYPLVDWLTRHDASAVLAPDFGLELALPYLTGGRISLANVWKLEGDRASAERFARRKLPDTRYVVAYEPPAALKTSDWLIPELRRSGVALSLAARIPDGTGQTVFDVYERR